jgi:hypothetical protein
MIDCWVYFPLRVIPNTVEVDTGQVATSRTIDNAVGVEHRNDLEDEIVSENLRVQGRPSQVIQYALHYPRGGRLARVHTRGYNHALTVFNGFRVALKGGNDYHLTVIACDGLRQGATSQTVLALRVLLQVVQVANHVCIGVRVAVSQVNHVVVMVELHAKGQCVIVTSILSLHGVLVVADISTASGPSFATSFCLDL